MLHRCFNSHISPHLSTIYHLVSHPHANFSWMLRILFNPNRSNKLLTGLRTSLSYRISPNNWSSQWRVSDLGLCFRLSLNSHYRLRNKRKILCFHFGFDCFHQYRKLFLSVSESRPQKEKILRRKRKRKRFHSSLLHER